MNFILFLSEEKLDSALLLNETEYLNKGIFAS
jgi:hypothetical protein